MVEIKRGFNSCCNGGTSNLVNAAAIAFPAFGAGILLTVFLPPCVLVGVCAAAAVAFGVLYLIYA